MMDKAERDAVWHESVERFGTRLQSVVCMEECAELIQAVSKRLRGKPDPEDNLAEEMADVVICLQIMYDITDEELGEWVEGKTVRQQRRNEDDK
ncbi:MazG nucleotide pyrophosphohydrolase domain-containing protein [Bifidobacterium pseudocatenulatum]|uniref:MazG nucleotide pyrophosphohydrolase domain-containing protein n=1 Tax=Bifidobacterium pseudocatenulatum TaxID=28026 RepID=UPI001CFEF110|nr:MazG nucleotide pyrophosphohydrolase domain-containing protein [Bifidobacterium pseudocatenulatum]